MFSAWHNKVSLSVALLPFTLYWCFGKFSDYDEVSFGQSGLIVSFEFRLQTTGFLNRFIIWKHWQVLRLQRVSLNYRTQRLVSLQSSLYLLVLCYQKTIRLPDKSHNGQTSAKTNKKDSNLLIFFFCSSLTDPRCFKLKVKKPPQENSIGLLNISEAMWVA